MVARSVLAIVVALIGHAHQALALLVHVAHQKRGGCVPAATAQLVRQIFAHGLPPNSFLNVNAPALPRDAIRGLRRTRLGQRVYHDKLIERHDPRGRPYYWIGGDPPGGIPDEAGQTDVGALALGFISVTPLTLDMTDQALLGALAAWGL